MAGPRGGESREVMGARRRQDRKSTGMTPDQEGTFWNNRIIPVAAVSTLVLTVAGFGYTGSFFRKGRALGYNERVTGNENPGNCIDGLDDGDPSTGLPCSGSGQVLPRFDNADKGSYADEMRIAEHVVEVVVVLTALYFVARMVRGRPQYA